MQPTNFQTGNEVRLACRTGELRGPTPGMAPGYVQANLVCLPAEVAADFEQFCRMNSQPCPLLEVLPPGCVEPVRTAPGADVRFDLPRYRIWLNGECTAEPAEISCWWRDDLQTFLLGCSFTFENALLAAGVPVRHIDQHLNVPMYRTNIDCQPVGRFAGKMVVSMRPMTPQQAKEASEICGHYQLAHGRPIQIGEPAKLGISSIDQPDYGDAVPISSGEVPVFWACGVTPQSVLQQARLPFAITHAPGHMFVTDLQDSDLCDKTVI
ncbi:MAG: putative hydro-lyase [Zavarzinella sp.]